MQAVFEGLSLYYTCTLDSLYYTRNLSQFVRLILSTGASSFSRALSFSPPRLRGSEEEESVMRARGQEEKRKEEEEAEKQELGQEQQDEKEEIKKEEEEKEKEGERR